MIDLSTFRPAKPRWATPRTSGRPTVGPFVEHYAGLLGFSLMPWQRQVAYVAGELVQSEGGLWVPAYRTVTLTVPRQSGKTTLLLATALQRALHEPWGVTPGKKRRREKQHIVYTMQDGTAARKKLTKEWFPLLGYKESTNPRDRLTALSYKLNINGFSLSKSEEAAHFLNGSTIGILSSSKSAGHGDTTDLAFQDELFADTDNRRDASMVHAMKTKRQAQIWKVSTMGTEESVIWNAEVARGRAAVEEGLDHGVAYFEWSAPEGSDPDDEDVWYSCMPALGPAELGFTQSVEVVRAERISGLPTEEFIRGSLNITLGKASGSAFGAGVFDALVDEGFQLPDLRACSLAFHAGEDGRDGVIAAACTHADGAYVTVVKFGDGTGWLPQAIVDISRETGKEIAFLSNSPAEPIASEARSLGANVKSRTLREYASSCSGLFVATTADTPTLRHSGMPLLVQSATTAHRKRLGGGLYVWEPTIQSTPLIAASLAYGAHFGEQPPSEFTVVV